MKMNFFKNNLVRFVIYTYGLFVVLIFTFGGIAKFWLHGTPLAMNWVMAITAWTSTFVLLLMFRKLFPNQTLRSFYKQLFKEKLNARLLVFTILIQIGIYIASICLVSQQSRVSVLSFLDFSFPTIASGLFFAAIQGATGEESAWRGYVLPAAFQKIGVVKGSLIVSLLWAFWHAPIWFLNTGLAGLDLFKYIIVFVICITSLGFIIGISFHHCKNLLVPILLHFTFNFLGETYQGPWLDLVFWYAVFYFIVAIGFFLWHLKNTYQKKGEDQDVKFIHSGENGQKNL
ncbi:MAG: type II CAAX endopeptidase family protein [Candidatus Pacebacteria bacterium]|nr:type II CAAX endopeptidase family protein [Candidatus Paceibacterota bacterium]